ncbi:MAG TPA: aldehyde dehydrogenase family protein [Streptosporangiaceae bacterium]|nr:aldehyde dehydrogenase family protein [Streptosporangiaceae bacterium]
MPSHDARLFLAGRYVAPASDESVPVRSPVTGEHLADLPVPTADQIGAAVTAARSAFDGYRKWSAYERAALCHAVADLIEARADTLARLTTLEQGKPYHSEAHGDVEDTAALFRVSAEDALRLYGQTIPSSERGKRMLTWRAPVGVWAAVTPWNFPLMIAAEFIAPALATGNAVVAKPPSITPLACLALGEILAGAGVPDGLVSILPGDGKVGERLVTHPGVDAIGFVGSSATAEKIVRAAGLKRSIIEASGNGPVVVLADADLARAAQAVVYGAYWNAGQVCCATECSTASARTCWPQAKSRSGRSSRSSPRTATTNCCASQTPISSGCRQPCSRSRSPGPSGSARNCGWARSSSTTPPTISRTHSPSAGLAARGPAGAGSAAWRNCST